MYKINHGQRFQGFIIFIMVLGAVLISYSEVKAALSLLSGRTFDEAHDLGYIDWTGSVGYANITHRDSICPSTCVDTVTQISTGSQISGAFDRDVGSFDVLVATVTGQGYGTVTVAACGVTTSVNTNIGVGATPGYFKIFLSGIASTCRSWSVSASGGNVYVAAVDVTYAVPALLPPTISGSLPCTVPGANSWCVSGLSLDLTASDPQGYSLIISGDIDSAIFSCLAGDTFCSIPISTEGSATANFKATSSVALSSSDSVVYKLDGTAPDLTGTVSGATGNPGWYISNVDLSFSATDAVSGVAKIETQVNGGGWTDYTLPITLSDGVYTVESRATDVAGNVSPVASQTFNIDELTPIITSTLSGVPSSTNSSWYVSDVQVSSSVTDAGSGVASFQVNVDNNPIWTDLDYTLPTNLSTLTDGIHTIQFRATDQAGNSTTSAVQTIQIDQVQPSLSLPITGTTGSNGWYISNTLVTVNASDAGSGVLSTEALQDGAAYAPYTAALSFTEGQHTYQAKVTDVAGNITETPLFNMNVDTTPPAVTLTPAITLGQAALYTLMDNGSQLGNLHAEITDSGGVFPPLIWDSALTGSAVVDQFVWDGKFAGGISALPGTYQATLTITDVAGNKTVAVSDITINVLSFIQPVPVFHPPSSGGVYHPVIPTAIPPVVFGGVVSPPAAVSTPSIVSAPPAGGNPMTGVKASVQSSTKTSPSTTLPPLTTSTVLWGAASAAAVGFFLIDAQKRKEEEEAKLAEAQRLIEEREAEARVALDALHEKEREALVILQAEYERAEAERKAEEQRAREEKLAARAAAAAQKLAERAWAAAQQAASAVVTKVQNTLKPSAPSKASTPSIMAAMTSTAQKPPASLAAKAVGTVGAVAKAPGKAVAAPAPVVTKAPAKTSLWGSITSAVSKVTTSVVNTVKAVAAPVVTPVVNAVKKVVTPVVSAVKTVAAPIVKAVVAPVANAVKAVAPPIINTVKTVATPVVNAVKAVAAPVINTVKTVATNVASTVKTVATAVADTVKNTVNAGTTALASVLSAAKEPDGGGGHLAAPALDGEPPTWWEKIANGVEQAWDSTTEIISSAWNTTKTVAADFGNLVLETGKSLSESFNQTVVPTVKKVLEQIWDDTKKMAVESWNGVEQVWNNRTSRIKSVVTTGLIVSALVFPPIIGLYAGLYLGTEILYGSSPLTLFGIGPEYHGVDIALQNKKYIELITDTYNSKIQNGEIDGSVTFDPIMIEAAFAIQNQWNISSPFGNLDTFIAQHRNGSSTGLAQLKEEDLQNLQNQRLQLLLPPGTELDPSDPYVATAGMIGRLAPVVEFCAKKGCEPVDQLIAISMAQNGNGFDADRLRKDIMSNDNFYENGQINWEVFLASEGPKNVEEADGFINKILYVIYNGRATPGNFDTEFMLQRYVNDMVELHKSGEPLPDGITESELDYMKCLANDLDLSSASNCPRP